MVAVIFRVPVLRINPTAVLRSMANRLEAAGLVERILDPAGRRGIHVVMTGRDSK